MTQPGMADGPRPRTFVVGETVAGRFRIENFLGAGGMGEVYEAEDLELNQRVALKTLLPEMATDGRMIERFKREVQLARTIAHPSVCQVYGLERHPQGSSAPGTVLFLTMELLRGETLRARLDREGRLAAGEVVQLVEQMAGALDASCLAGVIHRDFKPSNVMLVQSVDGLRVVVTDFGLARRAVANDESTATLSGQLMGTPDYMAPEVLAGGIATPASDIYALGVVTYQLLAGELPHRGAHSAGSIREKIRDSDPAFARALCRALDPNPSLRFSTALDFVRAIRGDSRSVTVRLPSMGRKRWAAALLSSVVLIAAVASWVAWRGIGARPSPEAMSFYQRGVDDIHAGAYFAATEALNEAVRITPRFALAHARLAEAWIELEVQERAQEEMVRAQREDMTGLPERDSLEITAISLTITREFDSALQKYRRIAQLSGAANADVSVELGRAFMRAGQPDPAIQLFSQVAHGPSHGAAAWLWLGILSARKSEAAESAQAFDEAEKLYRTMSNLEGLIEVAYQRGIAAYRAGRLEDSAAYYRQALEVAHSAGNVQQEIRAKLQLSTNAYLSGDAAAAERYAHDALERAQANQMETLVISGVVNLGNACVQKRDFACAEKNYQDALTLARHSGSSRMTALSMVSLAALHYEGDRYDEAAAEAQQALIFYQANRFADETIKTLTLLGRADYHRGQVQPALDTFQRLLVLAEKSQNHPQMALAHENIGLVYSRQQRYLEALGEYRKNLELSADPIHAGYARLQCGGVLWLLGLYDDARLMFEQADSIVAKSPQLGIALMRARGNMSLSRNDYGAAAAQAKLALATKAASPTTTVELTAILGSALLGSGHKAEGLRLLEEALVSAGSLTDDELLLNTRLAVLKGRLEAGDRAGAFSIFHQLEPGLNAYPESRWRALALISRADGQYVSSYRQSIDQVAERFGKDGFQTYRERPDIKDLLRSSESRR